MQEKVPPALSQKVRRLTAVCLTVWLLVPMAPVLLARSGWRVGPWPLDFWTAAQGAMLVYLLLVALYAWLVNRWEREAGRLCFEPPATQDQAPVRRTPTAVD